MACNIDKTDRINRIVIGALLVIAALLGAGKIFLILVGLVLMFEGIIGWCSIPIATEYLKEKFKR